jgi:hypothetical protein
LAILVNLVRIYVCLYAGIKDVIVEDKVSIGQVSIGQVSIGIVTLAIDIQRFRPPKRFISGFVVLFN